MKPSGATDMQALAHSATASRSTVPASTQPADAWRREMERVQAEAWFKGRLPQRHADSHAGSAAPHVRAGKNPSSFGMDVSDLGMPGGLSFEGSNGRAAVAQFAAVNPAAPQGRSAVGPTTALTPSRTSNNGTASQQPDASPLPAKHRPAALALPLRAMPTLADAAPTNVVTHEARGVAHDTVSRAEPHKPASPVRVHIETEGGNATVWLGVDGPGLALVPQVVRDIATRLAHLGYAAPRWVCNGQPYAETPTATPQRCNEADRTPASPIHSGRQA